MPWSMPYRTNSGPAMVDAVHSTIRTELTMTSRRYGRSIAAARRMTHLACSRSSASSSATPASPHIADLLLVLGLEVGGRGRGQHLPVGVAGRQQLGVGAL